MTELEREIAKLEQEAGKRKAETERAFRNESHWHDLLASLREYTAKNWWVHVIRRLQRDSEFLKTLRGTGEHDVEVLESLYRVARPKADEVLATFPATIAEECLRRDLALDETSRHPHYTYANGFMTIEIREPSYSAIISARDGERAEIGADAAAVAEKLFAEKKRLFDRALDQGKLLQRLYTHYRAVIRDRKLAEGEAVPIRRITARMSRDIEKFSIDEFNVDLGRLVQQGDTSIHGKALELSQTRDTHSGMLLHGLESRGYIGFVAFKEVDNVGESNG